MKQTQLTPRIALLSPLVANQIAAGEVIERPASVIKELLENALDAGADSISIDVGYGGLNHIKLSDNGVGIVADDLPLAVAAHATSKIRALDDLYAIDSMGFRGEALASISAVSRLSICSKPSHQDHAMAIQVAGGCLLGIAPSARSQGTTIEVLDLFFNAPVRKTFLKTPRYEYQAIEHVVKRFALSAPHIALTLSHNGVQTLMLPAVTCEQTRLLRIKKILGKAFVDQSIYVDIVQSEMHLLGWISNDAYQRSQNDKQWIYMNHRMVKDKLLSHAVKRAYEAHLHPGRHPTCLLYLTIPPQEVDVNVHPTKHEVRFQQPRLVHDFICSHLTDALESRIQPDVVAEKTVFVSAQRVMDVREGQRPLHFHSEQNTETSVAWHPLQSNFVLVFLQEQPYLIDITVVQQHRITSLIAEGSSPLPHRPLLVPIRLTMQCLTDDWFEHHEGLLAELGISLDRLSDSDLIVRTIPLLCPQLDIKLFLRSLDGKLGVRNQIISCFLAAQPCDAHHLASSEKGLILSYLMHHVVTLNLMVPGCLPLDSERCRSLFGMVPHE